jgi:hypothetical protein
VSYEEYYRLPALPSQRRTLARKNASSESRDREGDLLLPKDLRWSIGDDKAALPSATSHSLLHHACWRHGWWWRGYSTSRWVNDRDGVANSLSGGRVDLRLLGRNSGLVGVRGGVEVAGRWWE